MKTLPEQIVALLSESPGLTDREITNQLLSPTDPHRPINNAAKSLVRRGIVICSRRNDGLIATMSSQVNRFRRRDQMDAEMPLLCWT